VQRFPFRALAVSIVLAAAAAGCGGSSGDSGTSGDGAAASQGSDGGTGAIGQPLAAAPKDAKKGGTLKVLSAGDVDSIDPGLAYYAVSYQVLQPTLAPLYDYAPGDPTTPVAILASGPPEISADGKTVTVKLRQGFRFSPPVNREVTSKDVKYAMERGFTKNVPNGYVTTYFNDIVGVKAFQDGKAKEISGIQTPDDSTLVLRLSSGGVAASALVLPITSPVPPEYAKPYDARSPSTYGMHQVSAGPYMVKQYKASQSITLVRNPNWDGPAIGDPRPAYLDRIDFDEGNDDDTVASRRILNGQSMASGDFTPPPSVLRDLFHGAQQDQLQLSPGTDVRYVAMNTTIKPFDDINVRKAVVAAYDRKATLLARGGPFVGDVASHFLYPGVPGFEQAGGMKGPGYDFLAQPSGDMQLAASYLKKAGYANGKYSGPAILMVGSNDGVRAQEAQIAQQQLEKLGFKVTLRLLSNETMFTKFCDVTKAQVAVCPNVGWYGDFADPQTDLDPTFNGKNILPQGNSNWSQLDDPKVNAAMDRAEKLSGAARRATAWAAIDRMVTALAPAVPTVWDKRPTIESKNVAGVNALWNLGYYDLAYTSLR
jgi:peptide/nickel transport system substrate-binding protein